MRRLAFFLFVTLSGASACKGAKTEAPYAMGTSNGSDRPSPGRQSDSRPKAAPESGEAQGRAYSPADDSVAYEDAIARDESAPEPSGLGTAYGESRQSVASTAPFVRAHTRRPDEVLALWYDDQAGIQQAVDIKGGYFDGVAWVQSADGTLSVSLVDEYGHGLPGIQLDDKRYAVGDVGQRYMIAVQNDGPDRVEAVASVDGQDVIDGQTASYRQRGYVVEPYTSMMIEGWRTSMNSVAAFRFSPLEESYADRKGHGRNVGVIGVAFFHEKPARDRRELRRRNNADPFPGR